MLIWLGVCPALFNVLTNKLQAPLALKYFKYACFLCPLSCWAFLFQFSCRESMSVSSFYCNPLLLSWSLVGMVIRCEGGEVFYNLL